MAAACKIYCGKFYLTEEGDKVPSCLCSAMTMIDENRAKNNREAVKFMPRSVKQSFHNKKYKYIDDLNYNQTCIYKDWVKDLKKHLEIFERVVEEHTMQRREQDDDNEIEYFPEEMEMPEGLVIPLEHYFLNVSP